VKLFHTSMEIIAVGFSQRNIEKGYAALAEIAW
jgi:hypothetical protein